MRNVSGKSCRANQNIHFVFSNFFLSKNRTVYDNVENKATGDNMAHAHCIVDI